MDQNGDALISDFGLSVFKRSSFTASVFLHLNNNEGTSFTTHSGAGGPRWMAPELHLPEDFGEGLLGHHSKVMFSLWGWLSARFAWFSLNRHRYYSDFNMQIYSGNIPFYGYNICMAVSQITKGKRPDKPTEISDHSWRLANQCWIHYPSLEPSIEFVDAQLKGA